MHYFENRSPQEIQLGLGRIKTVAERLQLLPVSVPVISVAGTNGKGSTVATLEAIYTEAGYRVGVYTSPHLLRFNERIRCNQQDISDTAVCELFAQIEAARESIHLTYFEMATLAALMHFKITQAEIVILEVGLGGRLDATNIVDADLAIITTIDFDHEAYLGNTLEAIGFEKAGILRPQQTLVYADRAMPKSIAQRASELNVSTLCLGQAYDFDESETHLTLTYKLGDSLTLPKPNIHAHAAASAVVAAMALSSRLPITPQNLENALQKVYLAGRRQVIYGTMCTVLDVSHNPQSVALLAKRLEILANERPNATVHAIFSGLKDKDLYGLINPMHSWVDRWYSAVLDNPRAASEVMIGEAFERVSAGLLPCFYRSIVEAYQVARQNAVPGDIVVVYGSFFVVSPIMLSM